jgi:glutamyl-tRNA synthetase
MDKPVRVRFAPSPTGFPHVGNIRTAMFNWLFAHHTGGKFILRIEDTDVARTVPGAVEAIMDGLKWLGLNWDEGPDVGGDFGPYQQSLRLHLYKETAEKLVAQGDAYYCYCSSDRLETMRKEQIARKLPPGYDRHCRCLDDKERAEKVDQGVVPVVRFKTPLEGQTRFTDLIYGEVVFEHSTIDDFVLLKSDGYPTYHLANVVDDHAMKISHVIRAEEWVSSAPRHLLLYQALKLEPPQYVHHPMIFGSDHAKLSKRHGAVSILDYRAQGYLPETMFNFLSLLGWSVDDKTELMSRQELVENFSLERIGKSGAIFNKEKLDWMNGIYIRNLKPEDFVQRSLPFMEKLLQPQIKRPLDIDYVRQAMSLVQERAKTLVEVPSLVDFFFDDDLEYDAALLVDKKTTRENVLLALEKSKPRLEQLGSFTPESLEAMLRPLAEDLGLKAGQLFGALRTATTGRLAAPPLFQTMSVLGKERCLKRVDAAINKLQKLAS